MNPENIQITKITSLPQKFFKKGNFFLIPLRMEENEKPLFLRFENKKFKIFQHNHGKAKNFSLGLEIVPQDATEKERHFEANLKSGKIFISSKKIDLRKTRFLQNFLSKMEI